MIYTYRVLKTSWGIVVFIELEEMVNVELSELDVKIAEKIFLRIGDINFNKDFLRYWLTRGIYEIKDLIYDKIENNTAVYSLKMIDFSLAHFQEQGLYYAVQGWFDKYYGLELPPVNVHYNKELNKYVFPDISDIELYLT